MHQIKGLVDVFQAHGVGHEFIQLDLAFHVTIHVAWQFGAAFYAAEGGAFPDPTGNQLERAGGNFFTGTGHANDHGFAPALVTALQRRTHHVHVPNALEGVVHTAIGELHNHILNRITVLGGIDEVGGTELTGHGFLVVVQVDGNDALRLGHHSPLDHRQSNAAETKYGHGGAGLYLGGIQHGTDAGGDAAAKQANLVHGGFLAHLGQGNFRHYGVFGEGAGAHVVVNHLAVHGEAAGAVGHQALALGGTHGLAQVGLAAEAELALATLGGVQRNHMVPGLQAGDPFAHFLDDARAFVAKDGGEDAFRILAGQSVGIGMTNTGRDDLHQYLTGFGAGHIHFFNDQGFACFPGDGGT